MEHNRQLLSVLPSAYPDWIVTVTFYVALHAVDSLLMYDKIPVTSHDARNAIIIRTNRYKAVKTCYLTLYDLSRTVRYLASPADWVPADQIETNVIARNLYPIEKSVQHLIGHQLGLPKISLLP